MSWRAWVVIMAALLAGCSANDPKNVRAGAPCEDILDCASIFPLACQDSACARITCARTVECPIGAACVDGLCRAAECVTQADCDAAAGARCFEGDCRDDLCASSAECAPDRICTGNPPQCAAPPSICVRDADCPDQTVCDVSRGACVTACGESSPCPDGSYCDARQCRSLCVTGAQCRELELCIEGKCALAPDCSGRAACPAARPFRRPEDCVCVACLVDTDCDGSSAQACVDQQCVFCLQRATSALTCASAGSVWDGQCCVSCRDTADCDVDAGESCLEGRCVNLENLVCQTDSDCPAALRCDGSRCADSSLQPCAQQADCPGGQACYPEGRCRAEAAVCASCPAPSRCVAEPQDTLGTCAGCATHCAPDGCPSGQLCQRAGEAEGRCVDAAFLAPSCP